MYEWPECGSCNAAFRPSVDGGFGPSLPLRLAAFQEDAAAHRRSARSQNTHRHAGLTTSSKCAIAAVAASFLGRKRRLSRGAEIGLSQCSASNLISSRRLCKLTLWTPTHCDGVPSAKKCHRSEFRLDYSLLTISRYLLTLFCRQSGETHKCVCCLSKTTPLPPVALN